MILFVFRSSLYIHFFFLNIIRWRNEEEFEQLGAQSSSYDGGDGGDGIEDSFRPLNPTIVSGKGSWSGRCRYIVSFTSFSTPCRVEVYVPFFKLFKEHRDLGPLPSHCAMNGGGWRVDEHRWV